MTATHGVAMQEPDDDLSVDELMQQAHALIAMAEAKRARNKRLVIDDILQRMASTGVTIEDLHAASPKRKPNIAKPTNPKRPRYYNPNTGEAWSGIGRAPKWIRDIDESGRPRSDFLVAATDGAD